MPPIQLLTFQLHIFNFAVTGAHCPFKYPYDFSNRARDWTIKRRMLQKRHTKVEHFYPFKYASYIRKLIKRRASEWGWRPKRGCREKRARASLCFETKSVKYFKHLNIRLFLSFWMKRYTITLILSCHNKDPVNNI